MVLELKVPAQTGFAGLRAVLPTLVLYLISFSFLLLRLPIERRLRITGAFYSLDAAIQRKHLFSLALYALAMPLAYYHPSLALADIALVTLIWIIPTAGAKFRDETAR
jgi:uncharacterized membrane protein